MPLPGSLELKNLSSSKSLFIDPAGATMGREGGDAEIQIRDGGMSRKHAHFYEDGGVWYVEDLGSSNGTYVDRQQIRNPTAVARGAIITIARQEWEVLGVVADDVPDRAGGAKPTALEVPEAHNPEVATDSGEEDPAPRQRSTTEPVKAKPKTAQRANSRPGRAQGGDVESAANHWPPRGSATS